MRGHIHPQAAAIGQQVVQQLGTQLGLPQSTIDMAQAQVAFATGDVQGGRQNMREAVSSLGREFNLSPAQQGMLERTGNQTADNITSMMMDKIKNSADEETKAAATSGGKGGSLLMKIAMALGELMDAKMTEMAGLTDEIGGMGTVDNKNQSKMGELTGRLQGLSQEVNLLSNAMTTSIKTIGEASSTISRKG